MNWARQAWPAVRWFALYAAATLLFSATSDELRISHGVIVYLLLIMGSSATVGRWLGLTMVLLGYLSTDWYFVPPIHAFGVPRDLDGVVLAGFAVTGIAVSGLLASFREAFSRAEARAAEIERLAEDRRRLAEEVARAGARREADEVRTALLGSVAHDLRTPLSAIRLSAESAGGAAGKAIVDQVALLTSYVGAVQEFARVGVGVALRRDANVAEDLIGAAVRSAEAVLRGHAVQVNLPQGSEVLVGDFDFTLALRALVNLLENGARYAPQGTVIDVTLSRDGQFVRIAVRDRGPGIPADEAERVFDPFQRGSATAGTTGQGLGLAIARTFARAQGGEVRYRPREGGGSEFVLDLPLRSATAAIETAES